ncbi:unnamed protein product [Lathyrus sativus]|nr:unnamed protein product [Lathyrus sativus]
MGGRINGFDWVKGKIVGTGSFGSVHLAMNKSTGGLFVAKTANSDAGRDALQNEVNILNTLKNSSSQSPSPYIIQCLGSEYDHQDNNKLHVFMEYMAGGSLADALHNFGGSFDEHVVRLYTRQILLGLYHLHQQGIVHCDLKCKNVLLSSSGTVKLADFGFAKRISKDSSTDKSPSSVINNGGTPLWMAPEVLLATNVKDERAVDFAAADIWSLGCTVIEMATGRPPWVHDDLVSISNPMSAMFKIACGDGIPQFPSHFSQEGFDFLRKCLARDPNKRSTAKDLLNHPFLVANTLTYHKRYCNSSPAAVLDVHQFEDDYDGDDESYDYEEKLPSPEGRNKLLMGNDFVSPQGKTIWQQEDSASGNHWITIRSR